MEGGGKGVPKIETGWGIGGGEEKFLPTILLYCTKYCELLVIFQVCELDIIFNFEKAYFMLDELLLGGEVQETSKKNVLKAIAAQDLLQEVRFMLTSLNCF